jgi:RimJ/RimL family protein N-acetyltransferase
VSADSRSTLDDLAVLCVLAEAATEDGVRAAWRRLEAILPDQDGRSFCGAYLRGKYRACVARRDDDDAAALGLDEWTIPGGQYARRELRDWAGSTSAIADAFAALVTEYATDDTRPDIEAYRSRSQVVLFHPVRPQVALRPWQSGDLSLLEALLGDPAMTTYVGGPESPAQLRARHQRYLADKSSGLFAVVLAPEAGAVHAPEAAAVGWVGYWEKEWLGRHVWECGWSVLPDHHGRGIATAAAQLLIGRARADGRHRFLHAFPSVDNGASNAVCRKNGFVRRGEVDIEFPPGRPMRCNDWRLDLRRPEAPISL